MRENVGAGMGLGVVILPPVPVLKKALFGASTWTLDTVSAQLGISVESLVHLANTVRAWSLTHCFFCGNRLEPLTLAQLLAVQACDWSGENALCPCVVAEGTAQTNEPKLAVKPPEEKQLVVSSPEEKKQPIVNPPEEKKYVELIPSWIERLDELRTAIATSPTNGRTPVYTNGCRRCSKSFTVTADAAVKEQRIRSLCSKCFHSTMMGRSNRVKAKGPLVGSTPRAETGGSKPITTQ